MAEARVEIDIFSGRPNPSWAVDDALGEALIERIARLPEAIARAKGNDGLGYRGLLFRQGGATYRIGDGRIDGGGAAWEDPGRGIEQWLLSTMPQALRADLPGLPG